MAAPPSTPVACLQNGVENERVALRFFSEVYAVCVMCPTTHLEPGAAQAHSSPLTGILDLGRYPEGVDEVSKAIAGAFEGATFSAISRPDILRWKHTKLLTNLGNAVEAVCGPDARQGRISAAARLEGEACLRKAGMDFASEAEDAERRGQLLTLRPIGGARRGGGSSWQSLTRRAGAIETDYLNGEIVLLGRLHGVETPVNGLLVKLANRLAQAGSPPGAVSESEFLDLLGPA
jgi:2-dehydropantoate 2-reductase